MTVQQSLSFDIEEVGQVTRIMLSGSLVQFQISKLKKLVRSLLRSNKIYLVIDLRDITFIDSMGLGVIVGLKNEVGEVNGALACVSPRSPRIASLFGYSKLSQVVELFSNSDAALEAIEAQASPIHAEVIDCIQVVATESAAADDALADLMAQLLKKIDQIETRLDKLERFA